MTALPVLKLVATKVLATALVKFNVVAVILEAVTAVTAFKLPILILA